MCDCHSHYCGKWRWENRTHKVFGCSILDRLRPKVPESLAEAEIKGPEVAVQGRFAGTTILLEGEVPSQDLHGRSSARADLSGTDFSGANLETFLKDAP